MVPLGNFIRSNMDYSFDFVEVNKLAQFTITTANKDYNTLHLATTIKSISTHTMTSHPHIVLHRQYYFLGQRTAHRQS